MHKGRYYVNSQLPTSNSQIESVESPCHSTAVLLARVMLIMEQSDWAFTRKPYDLREGLFIFACAITRLAKYLHSRGPIAVALCPQLLKSGISAGANYEEADDGSSPSDTLAKRRIVLRELKETNFRLRILRAEQILTSAHDPVIRGDRRVVKIVATIVRNSRK